MYDVRLQCGPAALDVTDREGLPRPVDAAGWLALAQTRTHTLGCWSCTRPFRIPLSRSCLFPNHSWVAIMRWICCYTCQDTL